MKSTDLARRDREIKRKQKQEEMLQRRQTKKGGLSVGDYINMLSESFFHDTQKIYNITDNNEPVIEVLKEIKIDAEEKNWEPIFRKAIKKTGISAKEEAFKKLKELFSAME